MLAEVKRRQLSTNMFMKASQIYCYLKGSNSEAVKILVQVSNIMWEFDSFLAYFNGACFVRQKRLSSSYLENIRHKEVFFSLLESLS